MARKCALTTVDNPYNPFEQFTSWLLYDEEKGYHTCAYLGRIARTSSQLTEDEKLNARLTKSSSTTSGTSIEKLYKPHRKIINE